MCGLMDRTFAGSPAWAICHYYSIIAQYHERLERSLRPQMKVARNLALLAAESFFLRDLGAPLVELDLPGHCFCVRSTTINGLHLLVAFDLTGPIKRLASGRGI